MNGRLDRGLLKHLIPGTLTEISENLANYTFGQLPDDWDREDPEKMEQDTLNVERTISLLKEGNESHYLSPAVFTGPTCLGPSPNDTSTSFR